MNPSRANGGPLPPLFPALRMDYRDISWAGANPMAPGFCFGTEGGVVYFTNEEGTLTDGPWAIRTSGEAINGIAFSGDDIAVSTRANVITGNLHKISDNEDKSCVIPYGAHDIVSTPSGYFVAPLGKKGFMRFKAGGAATNDPLNVSAPNEGDGRIYFYRVMALPGQHGNDLLVCAWRDGGLGIMEMLSGLKFDGARTVAGPGLDIVDLCKIGDDPKKPAIVGVGLDGRLIFIPNVQGELQPSTTKFNSLQGTVYRVLSGAGHLVILTSSGLYVLAEVAARLLAGTYDANPMTRVHRMPIEAVDAAIVNDRWLLVVKPKTVLRFDLSGKTNFSLDAKWDVDEDFEETAFQEMGASDSEFPASLVCVS